MPKLNEVKRELRKQGCKFDHDGAKHEHWINPKNGKCFRLSRHNHEISSQLLKAIEKQAGVTLFNK